MSVAQAQQTVTVTTSQRQGWNFSTSNGGQWTFVSSADVPASEGGSGNGVLYLRTTAEAEGSIVRLSRGLGAILLDTVVRYRTVVEAPQHEVRLNLELFGPDGAGATVTYSPIDDTGQAYGTYRAGEWLQHDPMTEDARAWLTVYNETGPPMPTEHLTFQQICDRVGNYDVVNMSLTVGGPGAEGAQAWLDTVTLDTPTQSAVFDFELGSAPPPPPTDEHKVCHP